ncbi:lipopolysaccharide heptosyltransferase II, partial [Gammaproteobacteria bacterium]|nr:lipopolysaccharide heptosyltransferase II [Gammaproteobacteria bacterium]
GTLPEPLPYPALSVDTNAMVQLQDKFVLQLEMPALVLCPGAEFGLSKKWPEAYYSAVAEEMIKRGQQVWILGSENDQPSAEAIMQKLPVKLREHCKNFTGNTTLGEAIDLISLATMVVSNDSGLMHIAAALAKPLVVIYGSTSPDFTPPLAQQVKILSLQLECSPCFKRECPLGHLQCLKDLGPERVLSAIDEITRKLES